MGNKAPIFKDRGQIYHADTCKPLEEAVAAGQVRLNALARGHYPGRRLERIALPGIKSVGFWDAVGRQDWGLDWHRNEGIEITFLETGSLPFAVDGRPYPLRAGDLTITRPWQQHRVGEPRITAGRLHWVILDVGVRRPNQAWRWPPWVVLTPADLARLTDLLRHNEEPVWRATASVRHCFQQTARALEAAGDTGVQSRLTVHLNELFLAIFEMLHERKIALDPVLSSARRTVELFLDDLRRNPDTLAMPWTVSEMAAQCGLGVTAFTDYCKQSANMTPSQFLNHERVEAAARILVSEPSATVTDVALRCGFQSSQYFATVFRRIRGSSPRAFRGK